MPASFADSAVLIHWTKNDASDYAPSQQPPPFLHNGARKQGVPSSVISPVLDSHCWEQECAAEVIYVMHCHLLGLHPNLHTRTIKGGKQGTQNKIITACHSHCASRRDGVRLWRTNPKQRTNKYKWHKWPLKVPSFAQCRRLPVTFLLKIRVWCVLWQ